MILFSEFKSECKEDQFKELMLYNEVMEMIEDRYKANNNVYWHFKYVVGHQNQPELASKINILWEGDTNVFVIISDFIDGSKENKYLVTVYTRENRLLDKPGWKQFKSLAKRKHLVTRTVKQTKLRTFQLTRKYQYGDKIPQDYSESLEFDKENGNHCWAHTTHLEMGMMTKYKVFQDVYSHAW